MKPDEQQKQWLKGHLRGILKYRETYEEVYDHILLALENRPQGETFENGVNAIITDDFGGNKGLMMMERNCRVNVVTEVRKQYLRYFYAYLKFPYVIYTALIAVILGYIAIQASYKVVFVTGLLWVFSIIAVPFLLLAARKFKMGYQLASPPKKWYFFSDLIFPLIYLTSVLVILGYIAVRVKYSVYTLSESIWVFGAVMIFVLFFTARKFKRSHTLEGPLRSLKDSILGIIANKPFRFLFWLILCMPLDDATKAKFNDVMSPDFWRYIDPAMLIIVFAAATIHALSFVKLVKDEFKISVL